MDYPDGQEHIVQQPVALQDIDPGIDADEKRGEERQHDGENQDRLCAPRRSRDAVGERITHNQKKQRRRHGDPKAAQVGRDVQRVRSDQGKAVERQACDEFPDPAPAGRQIEHRHVRRLRDHGLRQADLQNDEERHQEEQAEPQRRNEHDELRPPRAKPWATAFGVAHRVNTTPASAGQLSHTRSSTWIGGATVRERFASAALIVRPLSRTTL